MQITDEARAMIGREASWAQAVVSKQEFQRWAAAVDDLNPLYFDEDYARAHGYRDVVMPPLFIGHLMTGVRRLGDLRPDGTAGTLGGISVPVEHTRRMAASEESEYFHPVYPGDTITATGQLVDIAEKRGRSGEFVLVTWQTTYHNQDDVLVALTRTGVVLR